MGKLSGLVGLVVGLGASTALAQAPGEDGPKVQQIAVVERGAFIEMDAGFTWLLNEVDGRKYGPGLHAGFYVGYDILPILNLAVGVSGIVSSVKTDVNTVGPVGDLFFVMPSLKAQFALLTTERNFLWVRGEAGFALGLPGKIDGVDYGGAGPAFGGAVGYERFAKLRHFSLGAVAGVTVFTKPGVGIGLSLMPTVKYTF